MVITMARKNLLAGIHVKTDGTAVCDIVESGPVYEQLGEVSGSLELVLGYLRGISPALESVKYAADRRSSGRIESLRGCGIDISRESVILKSD